MNLALIIVHIVISVLLIVVVLMQHGKQQGMSGAIAGGAETFFGKNKGRTIDAMLKKFTAVLAILFVVSSIVLTAVSVNDHKAETSATEEAATESAEGTDVTQQVSMDENGNLVDAEGNIVMTADQLAEANTAEATEGAEGEATEATEATEGENAEATAETENAEANEATEETPAE